jgi:hypothetical protein
VIFSFLSTQHVRILFRCEKGLLDNFCDGMLCEVEFDGAKIDILFRMAIL